MSHTSTRWIRCVWTGLVAFGLLVWFLAFAWEHDTTEAIPVHAGVVAIAFTLGFASARPSLRWALSLLVGAALLASGIALEMRSTAQVRREAQALKDDRLGPDYPAPDEQRDRRIAAALGGDGQATRELLTILRERRPGWGHACGALTIVYEVERDTADACSGSAVVCGTGTGPLGCAIRWRNKERQYHQEAMRIRELILRAADQAQ